MSKYRIPSTSSTKDPFALERSLSGNTLKPTANPTTINTGQELETLTPFQIEEGMGTLGNSQYQQQARLNQLANDEDFLSLTTKGIKNLVGTVLTETGKIPGYVVGGLGAIGNELIGDGKDSMKMMVDNSWINAFESMDKSIKDTFPVHIQQEVLDGGLTDKLSSGAWWATTGAEGVGFLLSMYGPGALLKAGKVGQKIMGGIESLANTGVDVANWLNLPFDAIKPYKMSLNTARNVDGYVSAFTNSAIESAAEAANTFDNIKNTKLQQYLNQGLSQEEAENLANQDAGKGAAAVFKTNMIILPVSNLLEEKWLWKSVGLSGQDEAANSLISQFMKDGILDIDGLKNATKKTFKESAGQFSKNFVKNFAKDGFFEEGLQTVTQQQVEKGNIKDNALQQFWESISQYTNDFENNKELHESIALGGLLGGGASVFQSINEARNNEEAIYGSRQGKFDGILNKIGLRQVRKDQRGLSNLLSQNWINNFKSYEDLLTDGKLDQEKLVKLPQEQQNLANLHFLYDAAVQTGDKLTQDIVGQYLATNYAQPFLGQVGGKEIFNQHVENQVVPEWTNRFKQLTNRDATNIEISEFKKRFLESANPVFDNYAQVEDTHYPERYYQDKDNPKRYNDFKNYYFNQKLQALTNITASDKKIAESQAKLVSLPVEGLTGIQKTNKKIAEADIEQANKIKKEASDYYESLFTKKGVKDLYDLYSKQEDTVNEVLEEVQQDQNKDAEIAQQKVEEIQKVEQQLDNISVDQPLTVKTKDGQLLEVMVDSDGKRYINDNGNIREVSGEDIIQNDIKVVQPEDIKREEQKQFIVEPEYESGDYNKVRQLAKSTVEGININTPENLQLLTNYPKLFEKYLAEESSNNNTEEPIDEKLHEAFLQNDLGTGLYPSTGVHVQYEYSKNRIYDKLNSNGLPLLNDSKYQRTWFETLDKIKNVDEYQVKVVNRTNANESELRVILANSDSSLQDNDLFIFLYQNDKPVIIDNDPVFTSLYRPDTLYKDTSKQGISPKLAPLTVYNAYLNSIGIQSKETLDFKDLSESELNKLESVIGKSNMNESGLWRAAVQWGKEDYTNWYNSLQQPNTFLQPVSITNGKRLVKRNADRSIVWNPVLNNIPDFKIKNQKLVGGDLVQQYTPQGIKVGDKMYKLRIGDTAIIANNQLYRLKQATLSESEVKSVLYLLSLKDINASQESINLPVRTVIKTKSNNGFKDQVFEETPVFGSNTEYGIIKSLINFGYGTSKGSIYFNGSNIEFIDWSGNLNTIPAQTLQNAFLDDDFTSVQQLVDFLSQKKFNVNENLLRADSDYQYPILKRTSNGGYAIQFENKGKYKAFLLESEKLLTDSVIAEGYPKRLARNLQFAKQPTIQNIEESVKIQESFPDNIIPSIEKNSFGEYSLILKDNTKKKIFESAIPLSLFERNNQKYFDVTGSYSNIFAVYNYLINNLPKEVNGIIVKTSEIDQRLLNIYETQVIGDETILTKKKSIIEPQEDSRLERLRNRPRTTMPNLNVDKIFSPSDLLEQKIKSGEITKHCI